MKNYLCIGPDDNQQSRFKVSKTPEIDYLINEGRFDEALLLINREDSTFDNLNIKGMILTNLKEFDKAIEVFNEVLKMKITDEVLLNKSRALYEWAKITYFPEGDYENALKLITDALDVIPEDEDSSEYYFLKAEILESSGQISEAKKAYLIAYGEYDKLNELNIQLNYLKNTDDILINITGNNFYDFMPEGSLTVDLIPEDDNEHDRDAIAVFHDGEKIGYVANSEYTLIDEVESASKIRKMIGESQKAEIQFVYLEHYIIARLL